MEPKKLNPSDSLHQTIVLLEAKRSQQLIELKQNFKEINESFKPANILMNTIDEITHSSQLRNGVGSAVVGVASGFLVKKILFGATRNPLLKLAGVAIELVAANIASKNSDTILGAGQKIIHNIISKIKNKKQEIVD